MQASRTRARAANVDRRDAVGGRPDVLQRRHQIGARGTQLRLDLRHVGLHHRAVGQTAEIARRLPAGERDERIEHRPRHAEHHAGMTDRVQPLRREGIQPARLAA